MDGNLATVTSGLTSTTATTHGDSWTDPNRQGSSDQGHSCHNRRHQGGHGNNRTPQSRFKSSVEGLEEAVYDSGLPNSSQNLFTATTEQIGEYVAKTYEHAGKFQTGLAALSFPPLKKPPDLGKEPTFTQQQEYQSEYKNWNKAKQHHSHNMQRVFALILGQCSDTIKNRI